MSVLRPVLRPVLRSLGVGGSLGVGVLLTLYTKTLARGSKRGAKREVLVTSVLSFN